MRAGSSVTTTPNSSGFVTRCSAIVSRRAVALVELEQRAEIDVGQRVARDDQEALAGEKLLRELDRARRSERRVLDDVVHRDAELGAVAEVGFDLVG